MILVFVEHAYTTLLEFTFQRLYEKASNVSQASHDDYDLLMLATCCDVAAR
jgi:hypothetical protein